VLGSRLVPKLVERGHHVTGTTRSPDRAAQIRAKGAEAAIVDALDKAALARAVQDANPDVVVHELTAIGAIGSNMRRFDRAFAPTNRLRTEGIDNLLAAAGGARVVAQSYAGWPFARTGGPVKTEEDPLDPAPPPGLRETLAAIRHLEQAVTGAGGLALRYGAFYGPGTSMADGGEQVEMIRKRRFPVVGDGGGVWSFVHIDDAAEATALAVEGGPAGVYNIVDDEPAPVREWLPALAQATGAKPPRHVPAWLGRLAGGEAGIAMMTEVRGASNAKAKRELGWEPRHPTWRQGFRNGR
jgi:nucleoside-diphosphate-sugar epimerase